MLNRLRNEPARVVAVVIALIGLASAFGLGLSDAQAAAIVSAVGAVLAILGGETIRAQVMPVGKARQRIARAALAGREDVLRAQRAAETGGTSLVPPEGGTRLD